MGVSKTWCPPNASGMLVEGRAKKGKGLGFRGIHFLKNSRKVSHIAERLSRRHFICVSTVLVTALDLKP